jgi:hypothetical protein
LDGRRHGLDRAHHPAAVVDRHDAAAGDGAGEADGARCGGHDGGARGDREVDATMPGGVRRRRRRNGATTTIGGATGHDHPGAVACPSSTALAPAGVIATATSAATMSRIVVRMRSQPPTRVGATGAGGRTGMRRCWPAPRHPGR